MVDALSDITILLAFVLALALLVERLLEVMKSAYDVIDSRANLYHFWTRRAEAIRDLIERRLRVFEYVSPNEAGPILNRVYQLLLNNQGGYDGTTLMLSGDLVRAAGVRLASKVVGMAVGIALALALDLDFVRLWQPRSPIPLDLWGTPFLYKLASGVAIGLGAGPVHKIIISIEKQRAEKERATGGAS